MKAQVLPESFLKLISPEDRKTLGKAGRTQADCDAVQVAGSERELQKQIVGLLRLKGIEANVSRMDKRKTDRVGWPDVVFAVAALAHCWEIKLPGGKLSPEQEKMAIRLQSPPNAWRYRIITSVDEAIAELKEMGL